MQSRLRSNRWWSAIARFAEAGRALDFRQDPAIQASSGADRLSDYQFNKKVIHHLFCSTCGIASFARGAGPDGTENIAINVRCLEGVDLAALEPMPFDGRSM